MIYYLFALAIPVLASVAHILLKTFALKKNRRAIHALVDVHFLSGALLFSASSVLSIIAMTKLDFSSIYSFTALNYAFITILSKFYLDEKLDVNKIMGNLVIIAGVLVYNL